MQRYATKRNTAHHSTSQHSTNSSTMPPNVGSVIVGVDLQPPTLNSGAAIDSPEQCTTVPVLSPRDESVTTSSDAARFVRENRSTIDRTLSEHGSVLFRGFPLSTPEDFNCFVGAFDGFTDLSYSKSLSFAVRTKLCDRICTTNEGRTGGLVFHHEQAQTPLWPSHVFFCCQTPALPGDGGETGIVSSPGVYEVLQKRHPGFCAKVEAEGVRYTVYAGPDSDPTKGAGRSWKSFFHVSTKTECEARMAAGGWTWEWGVGPATSDAPVGSDFLKCTTPLLEAVKLAGGDGHGESSGGSISSSSKPRKCFFNQLIATTANALEFSRVSSNNGNKSNGYDPLVDVPTQEGIDECVRFGSGDPIPLEILLEARQICEELAINVEWQAGDVLLLSNYLMMHARRPWTGPDGSRKLLASLVREENCTSFGRPLVA
mmetsp:Transcript_28979/g.68065  ORF Transcript_28979/g.68065 Transcript_28979/m.68065 type:complete len:429 (-) Transcript_28979:301-1587(-)